MTSEALIAPARSFGARYLLRFDDLCPTMNWGMWDRIEELLVKASIRPIVAVIPDNRDPKMDIGPADPPSPTCSGRVLSTPRSRAEVMRPSGRAISTAMHQCQDLQRIDGTGEIEMLGSGVAILWDPSTPRPSVAAQFRRFSGAGRLRPVSRAHSRGGA